MQRPFHGISIDQVAAGVVVILVARAGWEVLLDDMRVLLDASLDFETMDQVRTILDEHPMVVKVQSLIGRNAGRFRFLQANIILRTVELEKAHQVSEILEEAIRRKVPHVERVVIHYEPQPRIHARIAFLFPTGKIRSVIISERPRICPVKRRCEGQHHFAAKIGPSIWRCLYW